MEFIFSSAKYRNFLDGIYLESQKLFEKDYLDILKKYNVKSRNFKDLYNDELVVYYIDINSLEELINFKNEFKDTDIIFDITEDISSDEKIPTLTIHDYYVE